MDTVVMPKLSDMMEEGKILSWVKREGDAIVKGEALGEVETEKVNIDIESFFAGVVRRILVSAGQTVPVGTPIALIGSATEPLNEPAAQPAPAAANATPSPANGAAQQPVAASAPTTTNGDAGRQKISPLARRLAEEHKLDLATVHGTGPEGRIVKEDVEAAIAAGARPASPRVTAPEPAVAATSAMMTVASPNAVAGAEDTIIPLTTMRRTIARRLQQSSQTAPHFFVTMAMDATRLVELREQINDSLTRQNDSLRVSYNDLIVMAVSRTIAHHPEINVSFEEDRIVQHKHIHLGIAVALDTGLIVPVVRDADRRSAADLAREIRRLADAARHNKLRPDEFAGGTFTISNLGMLDVESFTAIINPPEVAILAIGAITPTPVVWEGQVVVRQQIKMTLSSDHRAIDGAQAAYFMRDLKQVIESPVLLLM